ncbi:MAG: alpha/beta fold hydrolase [Flexilinea sp.]
MLHKTLPGKKGIVHYWIDGDGEQCIVFTHGATVDHGLFQYQMEYFSHHYRVISWDVSGHGLSRPYPNFSLQNAADDLTSILNAEKINQAHLVGQSMGGYVCQIVAVDHPELVQTITAVDSSPIQSSYYSGMDRWILSITPFLINCYPYSTLIKGMAKQVSISSASYDYVLYILKTYTKSEIAEILSAVYSGVLQYDHANIPCPVLLICGEKDKTGKVKTYSTGWAENEKRPLAMIPDAAHNSNMDNPAAFNRALEQFVEDNVKNR